MRVAAITAGSVVAAAAAAGAVVGYKHYQRTHGAVDEAVVEVLKGNEKLLSSKELKLVAALLQRGQKHLFAAWPPAGTQDGLKRKLMEQLVALDASYHGGLCAYIDNALKLLHDSKEGKNAFDGYTPSVPHGEKLDFASAEFLELEQAGLKEAGATAFVLVAGGLGERLGYSGIKVALPAESATGMCFLELYARYIQALQARSGGKRKLPFAIMTSDDTHARTVALLEEHKYFGLAKSQVHLLKQEKVACLVDNDAHLALDPKDSYAVQTKPHGHGDVHALLHSSGLAKKWKQQGFKWVAFFQDTNALVFRALTAALGVSARHDYDMNSLAVPRKAKEAIGAIACLKDSEGRALTINVEYNQLDPLLRATTSPQGDVNDETGWSPFPGNINQLIMKLDSYATQLHRTGGIIAEFVNPKYKDATKTDFKSSTRLECMMQDYPKALPADAKVGFTTVNQVWASYSPVKNSPADAAAKFKEGNPTHSATTGELDIYRVGCAMLEQLAGATLGAPTKQAFNGIEVQAYPRVVLTPEFAAVLQDVKDKVAPGARVDIASDAVVVLDGADITIQGPLKVSGALVVRAAPGARVRIGELSVANQGWEWHPLKEGEQQQASEEEQIRGFRVVRKETAEYVYDKPGEYLIGTAAGASTAAAAAAETAPARSVDTTPQAATSKEQSAPTPAPPPPPPAAPAKPAEPAPSAPSSKPAAEPPASAAPAPASEPAAPAAKEEAAPAPPAAADAPALSPLAPHAPTYAALVAEVNRDNNTNNNAQPPAAAPEPAAPTATTASEPSPVTSHGGAESSAAGGEEEEGDDDDEPETAAGSGGGAAPAAAAAGGGASSSAAKKKKKKNKKK